MGMGKRAVLFTTVLAATVGMARVGSAGFLIAPTDPFTGNSQFLVGDHQSDGLVNFGVYKATDTNWTDDFIAMGIPAAAVNYLTNSGSANNALYVYMYQVVNTNPVPGIPEDPLEHLQIPLTVGSVISGSGYITNTVFDDTTPLSTGPTGPGGLLSNRLGLLVGTAPSLGDANLDGVPSEVVLTAPGLVAQGAAIEPTGVTIDPFEIQFDWTPKFVGSIPPSSWSSIVFFTSNNAPVYASSRVRDFGSTANELPTPAGPLGVSPTPEPSNFVMFGGVLVCGIVASVTYRRQNTLST